MTFLRRPMAILNGWKEIAIYLGRGIRTVQRWEEVGLPVRRPRRKARSPVVADSEELDAWLKRSSEVVPESESPMLHSLANDVLERFHTTINELRTSVEMFRQYRVELRTTVQSLRHGMGTAGTETSARRQTRDEDTLYKVGSSGLRAFGNGLRDSSVN